MSARILVTALYDIRKHKDKRILHLSKLLGLFLHIRNVAHTVIGGLGDSVVEVLHLVACGDIKLMDTLDTALTGFFVVVGKSACAHSDGVYGEYDVVLDEPADENEDEDEEAEEYSQHLHKELSFGHGYLVHCHISGGIADALAL